LTEQLKKKQLLAECTTHV